MDYAADCKRQYRFLCLGMGQWHRRGHQSGERKEPVEGNVYGRFRPAEIYRQLQEYEKSRIWWQKLLKISLETHNTTIANEVKQELALNRIELEK